VVFSDLGIFYLALPPQPDFLFSIDFEDLLQVVQGRDLLSASMTALKLERLNTSDLGVSY
jgi:hypothetical protein